MTWLNRDQLLKLNFYELGENVLISDRASIYGCERISISSNTRIDDFCVLSSGEGGISIGRNVHIATQSIIIGKSKITISDFCNLSSRVAIYSSSDDFSGLHMTNPTIYGSTRMRASGWCCDWGNELGQTELRGFLDLRWQPS